MPDRRVGQYDTHDTGRSPSRTLVTRAMSTTFTIDTSTSRANPTPAPMKRLTVPAIRGAQGRRRRWSMLTAYTVRMAQLLDPHCDMLLVGDSLGQVIYGLPSTLPVTLDMMARTARRWCAAAIMRWSSSTCRSAATRRRPNRRSPARRRVLKRNRRGGGQAGGRRGDGADGRVPVRARHSGDGPCRPDPAGGERARRLWRARAQRGRSMRRSSPMRSAIAEAGRVRASWSKAWSSRSRVEITERGRLPDDRHRRVGAVRRAGAGRPRTCSACSSARRAS